MKRVETAQLRMSQFPKQLVNCRNQALWYAKCVVGQESLKKGSCEKEFQALKDCVKLMVKKGK